MIVHMTFLYTEEKNDRPVKRVCLQGEWGPRALICILFGISQQGWGAYILHVEGLGFVSSFWPRGS